MWQGYYEQQGSKQPMKFTNFQANPIPGGNINGSGSDEVGQFMFSGTFNNDATKVRFEKKYQTHSVFYQGDVVSVAPPTIRGTWTILNNQSGNFEIKRQWYRLAKQN